MPNSSQSGFALVISLILLTILTMVAVIATRGAGLEVQMAGNSVSRIEAFDVAESTRRPLGEVIDVHTFARGWPTNLGGSVSPDAFDYVLPLGLVICGTASLEDTCDAKSAPRAWYLGNSEKVTGLDPDSMDLDARFQRAASATLPVALESRIAVYKLVTDLNPGSGAAMVSGYEGIGKASAAGGGRVFYYARSIGTAPNDAVAEAETAADYRHVIRN